MDEAEQRYFQCPKCGQLGSVPHEIIEQALAETPFVRINCATCNHGFPLEARDAHRPDLAATDDADADADAEAEAAQTGTPPSDAATEPDSSLPDWLSLPETRHPENDHRDGEQAPMDTPEAEPTQAAPGDDEASDGALNLPDTKAIETAIAAMQAIEPPSDGLPLAPPQPQEAPDQAAADVMEDVMVKPSQEPADEISEVAQDSTEADLHDQLVEDSAALINEMLQSPATAQPEAALLDATIETVNTTDATETADDTTERDEPPSRQPAGPHKEAMAAPLEDKTAEAEALGWPEKLALLGMIGAALAFFVAGIMLLRG